MRKSYFAIIALGALVIASCQKENSADLPKVDSPVFTATIDADSDTKTVLDGNTSLWNQDHIWILNGNHAWKKEYYTDATSSSIATFTESNKDATLDKGPVVAVCPASAGNDAWWNKTYPEYVNKLKLNPEQTATEGTYDPNAHIAVAYSENTSLAFMNAVSLLKFTVASDNVSEVCIYPNTSTDYVAGNFSIAVTGDYVGTISKNGGDDSEWKNYNYVKATGTFEKGNTYYIACLPTTFTTGFTVEVVSLGNKEAAKTTPKNYTLNRNKILDLGNVESTVETRTLYLDITTCWSQATANYDAWIWGDGMSGTWVDFEVANGNILKTTIPNNAKGIKIYRREPKMPSHDKDNDANRWNTVQVDDITSKNIITITDWWAATASDTIPTI